MVGNLILIGLVARSFSVRVSSAEASPNERRIIASRRSRRHVRSRHLTCCPASIRRIVADGDRLAARPVRARPGLFLSTPGGKRLPLPLRPSLDRRPLNETATSTTTERIRIHAIASPDSGRSKMTASRSKGDDHVQNAALGICPGAAGGDPMLLGIPPQTGNAIVVQGAQPARRSEDRQPGDNGKRNAKDPRPRGPYPSSQPLPCRRAAS